MSFTEIFLDLQRRLACITGGQQPVVSVTLAKKSYEKLIGELRKITSYPNLEDETPETLLLYGIEIRKAPNAKD